MQRPEQIANDNVGERREFAEPSTASVRTSKLEAVGLLTAGIVHDFKNVLTSVNCLLTILERNNITPAERRKAVVETARSVERGKALAQQLLTFSRANELPGATADLHDLVESMRPLIRLTVGSGVFVELDVASGIPAVQGDRDRIELALLNLVVNARDAMPSGGVLAIRAAVPPAEPHLVRLSVSDTGTGMGPETLERATEPYFTTKPAGKGTGLGLWLVQRLAAELGGGLAFFSEPGVGTTASLWLRAASDEHFVARMPRVG